MPIAFILFIDHLTNLSKRQEIKMLGLLKQYNTANVFKKILMLCKFSKLVNFLHV